MQSAFHYFATLASVPVVLALLAGCEDTGRQDPTAHRAAQAPISVGVVKVAKRPVNVGLDFAGRVEAINNVELIARVQGFLKERAYTEGQEVKAGDLLFLLEKDTYQTQVDAAQANLAKAQANADNAKLQADRARALINTGSIAAAAFDDSIALEKQTAATVLQAQASLEEAQVNLGYTEIRAPFDGRVGRSNFSVGALVGPNSGALAQIVSQDPIYVSFAASDRLVLRFQEQSEQFGGAKRADIAVRLTLATGNRFPHAGAIDFTGVKVDPDTDTLIIRAKFSNPERLLVTGQYVRVMVERKNPVEALVAPQRAVLTDQIGNFVMLVGQENRIVRAQVALGATQGVDVVVENGLKEGDVLVVEGLQRVRPGQQVDPEPVAAQFPGQMPDAKADADVSPGELPARPPGQ